MTIYFDENKQAFAYEIQNPIATTSQEIWSGYADTDKWDIINGEFKDISDTPEYKQKLEQKEKDNLVSSLTKEIEMLDSKRIRAIAEPELKNPESGETWLDFYTEKIRDLRQKISEI